MAEKIILFGGTFDPVHTGHIEVARAAAEKIGAKKIVLVPARRSPHKNKQPVAPDTDRIAMLQLAAANQNLFQISTIELNRAEPSYTIDTIRQLQQELPDCILYWLIGADMLNALPLWHKVIDLMDECNISVMNRGGFDKPDFDSLIAKFSREIIEKLKKNSIETPLINISSTEIRQKLFEGRDVSQYLHPDVLNYIKSRRLYVPTD